MIVLDTHVWIWWENGTGSLTPPQRQAIESEYRTGELGISVVSCWEIAMLVGKGRLQLGLETLGWFRTALHRPSVRLLPITPEIAVRAYRLPEPFHPDPADRLIVATAAEHGCPLATSDRRIVEYSGATTVH